MVTKNKYYVCILSMIALFIGNKFIFYKYIVIYSKTVIFIEM